MTAPPRRTRLTPSIALGFGLGLTFLGGCDQPTGSTRSRSKAAPVAVVDEPAPQAPAAPVPIVGAKTQDIRDRKKEEQAGGVATPPRITAKDPILLAGNAYVSIVSQAASQNIQHALDLYRAETGEFPKTLDEFMEKIIKANNIALPLLPSYLEYAYDAPQHKLVVMEYPDRKEKMNYPK